MSKLNVTQKDKEVAKNVKGTKMSLELFVNRRTVEYTPLPAMIGCKGEVEPYPLDIITTSDDSFLLGFAIEDTPIPIDGTCEYSKRLLRFLDDNYAARRDALIRLATLYSCGDNYAAHLSCPHHLCPLRRADGTCSGSSKDDFHKIIDYVSGLRLLEGDDLYGIESCNEVLKRI